MQVHLPHPKSEAFEKWLDAGYLRVNAVFDEFVAGLDARYEGLYGTAMCGDDNDNNDYDDEEEDDESDDDEGDGGARRFLS